MWNPLVVSVSGFPCQPSRFNVGKRTVSQPEPTGIYVHRKRARLDNLTEEEKMIRRKILNREAAQKARDRKKGLMENMEESLAQLRWENEYLRTSNRMLRLKFIEQEEKFQTLQKKLEGIIKHMGNITERRIEPQESAALLPQQKGVALCLSVLLCLYICQIRNLPAIPSMKTLRTIYHQRCSMHKSLKLHRKMYLKPKSLETSIPLTT